MPDFRQVHRLDRRGFLQHSLASALAAGGASRLVAGESSADPVLPIDQRMRDMEAAAALSMQFRGQTADDARRWQAEFAAKLRELLGPHQPPKQYECIVEKRVELPTHVREERLLKADGLAPVPVHLLLPRDDSKTARRPGILAIHGHGKFAHDSIAGIDDSPERKAEIEKFQYDYGLKLVQQGYVVAAPCLTPFGRRLRTEKVIRGDVCTLINLQLEHLGKLLITENLRDCLWALDFLAGHAAVDPARIGCAGLSYGGRMTMLTTALDPRIRVAVIGGAMCTLQESAIGGMAGGCQVIPGLFAYGDMPEIAGLIAPRTCVWTVGSEDRQMDPAWVERFRERQGRVYSAFGAADELYVDRFDGGHVWHGEVGCPVFARVLKNERMAEK